MTLAFLAGILAGFIACWLALAVSFRMLGDGSCVAGRRLRA